MRSPGSPTLATPCLLKVRESCSKWRVALQKVLFQDGNIIENKEKGEQAEEKM